MNGSNYAYLICMIWRRSKITFNTVVAFIFAFIIIHVVVFVISWSIKVVTNKRVNITTINTVPIIVDAFSSDEVKGRKNVYLYSPWVFFQLSC